MSEFRARFVREELSGARGTAERTEIEVDGGAELEVGQPFRVNKINGTIDGSTLFPGVWQVIRELPPRGGKRRYEVEKIGGNRREVRAKLAREGK